MFSHVLTAVYFKFERFCFCVGFNAKFCDVFVDARTSLCYAYRNEQEVCFVIMFTTLLLWWILLCEEFKLVYTPGHLAGHSPPRHLGGLWQVRPSWTVVIHAYLFVLLQCLSELLCMSIVHGLHLAVLHTRNQHSKRVEKVARLHNSFVGSMSPVARCTCLCCRSSTQRRNLVCHLVARGCGMTGPCVLGANARFPTAYVGTSVCILRVWSRHVAARYLSVFVVHVPSLLYAVFSAHTHIHTHFHPQHLHARLYHTHPPTLHTFVHTPFTNNTFTRNCFAHQTSICISCTHWSSTISCLFPALPIPSSPFFGYLLEEIDMWGYPVLYLSFAILSDFRKLAEPTQSMSGREWHNWVFVFSVDHQQWQHSYWKCWSPKQTFSRWVPAWEI